MKYKATNRRKETCDCSQCNKFITSYERAYTSSKNKFCNSCGHMENQYANEGMYRPAMVF